MITTKRIILQQAVEYAKSAVKMAVDGMRADNPNYRQLHEERHEELVARVNEIATIPKDKILAVSIVVLSETEQQSGDSADNGERINVISCHLGTSEIFDALHTLFRVQNEINILDEARSNDNCMCEVCQLRRRIEGGEEVNSAEVIAAMLAPTPRPN